MLKSATMLNQTALELDQSTPSVLQLNLTIAEACQALNVSRTTLYRLSRSKELKTVCLGRRVLIPSEEILRFQQRLLSGDFGHWGGIPSQWRPMQ